MKNKIVLAIFFLLVLVSGILITQVRVNYDLEKYLPESSSIRESIAVFEENFGVASNAILAIEETDLNKALQLKTTLHNLENIRTIVFVDDYLNELTYSMIRNQASPEEQTMLDALLASQLALGKSYPEALFFMSEFLPEEHQKYIRGVYSDFVSDEAILLQVIFNSDSSSFETEESLRQIEDYLNENSYVYRMKGDAVSAVFTRNTIKSETALITLVIIPIVLIILLILSKSFFDILVFGIVAAVAIIINLGTNALFTDISYITQAMAIALQLAISLDYIIFTLNSYHYERSVGIPVDDSIKNAIKKTRKPVVASALTTGVSFLALIVMRFSIGIDIGLVFAKAIIISLLTTLFLLPVLIKMLSKYIDRTRKSKFINFSLFATFAEKLSRFRYVFLFIVLMIIAPLVYFQTKNTFTYGVSSFSASIGTQYYEDSQWINDEFGQTNNFSIVIEKNDAQEAAFFNALSNLEFVYRIEAGIYYKTIIDDPVLIEQFSNQFYVNDYALFQVTVKSDVESETAFSHLEAIKSVLTDLAIEEHYLIGETVVSSYLKDIILIDFVYVLVIAIIAVLIIIFFSFKNMLIPIILIVVIEIAVFLSMSLINLFDQNLVFLAYLIVTTILLGATIDYAILFTKRYMEERVDFDKVLSLRNASLQTTPSIVTSALLFMVAGLTIAIISSINSIAQIGLLIATGALVAMIFVLLILPQILSIFDKFIIKSKI